MISRVIQLQIKIICKITGWKNFVLKPALIDLRKQTD